MKTLTHIIITIVVLFFASSANAATDSATSTLRLTVLPAFETLEASNVYEESVQEIVVNKTILVRSNTSWSFEIQPLSYGFVNPPSCYTSGKIGLSNGKANVGNSYQTVEATCVQPKSWADNKNYFFDFYYTTGSGLSL